MKTRYNILLMLVIALSPILLADVADAESSGTGDPDGFLEEADELSQEPAARAGHSSPAVVFVSVLTAITTLIAVAIVGLSILKGKNDGR